MKRIYFLRHATAVDGSGISDHERSLSNKGVLQMQDVSEHLIADNNIIDTVLCSSALRTQQTYNLLIQNGVMIPSAQIMDSLYLTSAADILHHIQMLDNRYNTSLIIGHNPGIATLCQSFNSTDLSRSNKHSLLTFTPATLTKVEYKSDIWNTITTQSCRVASCYS